MPLWTLWGRLILAGLSGALLGLITFLLSTIDGVASYVLYGLTGGVAVGGLVHLYSRTISLTTVTLSFPQVSQLTFVVNHDARQTAWQLFVEISTRISTQPLRPDDGFLREALNSLHTLFTESRLLLRESQPTRIVQGKTVEYLAFTMLNDELRPFLSHWHPRLTRFEETGADESDWEHGPTFRKELEALRLRMLQFATNFAQLAGVSQPELLTEES